MHRFLTLSIAFLTISLASTSALACINEVNHQLDKSVMVVSKAEQVLEQGQNQKAIKMVLKDMPWLLHKGKASKKYHKAIEKRAQVVVALATVRSKGHYKLNGRAVIEKNIKARSAAIQKAFHILDTNSKGARGNSPRVKANYAEGLALYPERHAEALEILEALASKDLLSNAFAYATLARLRAEKGNTAGGQEAQERCRKMAATQSICDFELHDPNG